MGPHGESKGIQSLRAQVVVTPTGEISPGEIIVENGLIAAVRPCESTEISYGVLLPGFIDMQVNGLGAVDVARARGGDWDLMDQALLRQGVTTWCPTLRSAPLSDLDNSITAIASAAARAPGPRPDIAGAHLEGPFLAYPGSHDPSYLLPEVDMHWLSNLHETVRMVTIAPEVTGALAAIRHLADVGVLVALGHTHCSAEEAAEASYAGARLVTHLGNVTGTFTPRSPGLFGAALFEWGLSVCLIADLVHIHPMVLGMAFRAKKSEVVLVTDRVAIGGNTGLTERDGAPTGSNETRQAAFTSTGKLAGSLLTMDKAITNAVRAGRVSLYQAVHAASTHPATLLRMSDRGALIAGRRADIVAMAGHPRDIRSDHSVTAVWVRGDRIPVGSLTLGL